MTIQYCSDLHLEFPINKAFLHSNPIRPAGEVLLLAGDIIPFREIERERDFLNFLSDSFEQTYWIPGNHEYYRSDLSERPSTFVEQIKSNVTLLNNQTVHHNGVRFLFSTLWSRINLEFEYVIRKSMADFHLIRVNGNKITIDDYNTLHQDCLAFITSQLNIKADHRTIVITHHLPTFMNYPEKYRGSQLSTAFATELSELIETSNIDYWIFGHSHEVVPDFQIGNTILTTNQLGYVEFGENSRFKRDLVIKF